MSGPLIHRLGPGDVALFRALNALFAQVFDDPASYAAAPPPDDWLSELLQQDHVIALVASNAGTVVGGMVAYELVKFEQARREIYIYDLAVAQSWRQRGIATALIGHLRGIARQRGAYVIYVQADQGDNPAIALYTKLGTREDVLHFDIEV